MSSEQRTRLGEFIRANQHFCLGRKSLPWIVRKYAAEYAVSHFVIRQAIIEELRK